MSDQHAISENLKNLVQLFDNQNKAEIVPVYNELADNFNDITDKLTNLIDSIDDDDQEFTDDIWAIISSMSFASNLFENAIPQNG